MATIGVTVGLLGWALKALIASLAGARVGLREGFSQALLESVKPG
jgi:hypothetical protein